MALHFQPDHVDGAAGSNAPVVDLAHALDPAQLKPWIEYEYSRHATEIAALLERYGKFLAVTAAGIENDYIGGLANDFANDMKAATEALDKTRERIKKPVLHAQRLIDGEARKLSDELAAANTVVRQRLEAWLRRKEAALREAAEKEAARLALEAQTAMNEAAASTDPHALDVAVDAIDAAQEAERLATASTLELTRSRGVGGGMSALKEVYLYEVVDITKVPVAYLQVNDKVVKAAIQSGTRDIRGLRIYAEKKLAYVRG
jgi:hypothetical protein